MSSDSDDLRKYWITVCDADPTPDLDEDDFIERMEAAGFIHLRPVTRRDLDEPFASERGIYPGGNLWELTASGQKVFAEGAGS